MHVSVKLAFAGGGWELTLLTTDCIEQHHCVCNMLSSLRLRSVLCQHHGDCGDVSNSNSNCAAVSSPQPQRWTDATLGESQEGVDAITNSFVFIYHCVCWLIEQITDLNQGNIDGVQFFKPVSYP